MKLLIASDHYPPFIGGAHRQTQLLAHELARRGHEVSVATVWHDGLPAEENEGGVRVHRLRQLRTLLPWAGKSGAQRHQPPFPDPATVLALRRLINRLQPELVHAYGWFSYSCALALAGRDIPLLITTRDYGYSCATRTLVYRGEQLCSGPAPARCLGCAAQFYGAPKGYVAVAGVGLGRYLLRRKARGIHSISSYVQSIVERDLLEPGALPVRVIPSFQEDAPADNAAAVAPFLAQLPKEPFILFVGALRLVKGVKQLLAAYRQLEDAPPLVLIGTLERDTPAYLPPGVITVQNAPHAAVMAAWERCLFGVVPSLWPEPLGSVVYEGMSRGKAVIGTTPGGHTDMIVDGESGLLVPPGDVPALVAAMRQLIGDPALREKLGAAARERAQRFTASQTVPRFESFYRELVAGIPARADDGDAVLVSRT